MTPRALKHGLLTAIAALLCVPFAAQARGPSPYLPLNLSPEIERQIERVLILGDIAIVRRPIPAAVVLEALPKACAVDQTLCKRVRRFLSAYMDQKQITHFSAELAYTDSDVSQPLPNRHALNSDDSWQVSAQAVWQPSDHFIIGLGGVADSSDITPTNTMLSFGWDVAQFDLGWRDHWLSPFTDSSMLVSTQGETMPGLTVSNYKPFTRLGITYEGFIAQMKHQDNIVSGTTVTSGSPRIAGVQIGIQPVAGWSLTANRILQYGGGSRSKSYRDLFNAFFNPSKYDNVTGTDTQFGNQVASITSRFVYPGRVPFAAYMEYAGEDTSHGDNYRLGNSALSFGIDFPQLGRQFDATYEISEWQNAWYVNGVYGDGLANDGYALGHWFGNERIPGDAVGGRSQMLRVGWHPSFGGEFDVRFRTIKNQDYGVGDYVRGQDITLRYSFPWDRYTVGAEVQAGKTVLDDNYARIAGFVRLADWSDKAPIDYSSSRKTPNAEVFVDAGVGMNKVHIDLADASPSTTIQTGSQTAPHLGVGARRAVGRHHDLGVRVEYDEADGKTLLAVRALDYRYRLGNHLAFSGFLGAARYNLATPAFGWYVGAGVQWRDVLPNVDIGVDGRFADKVARDKLLASDPPIFGARNDVFYDVRAASLYVSYRW